MLAQNLKTPTDLEIPDKWFDALLKVLGMLERGELKHTSTDGLRPITNMRAAPQAGLFNMNRWAVKFECGTICCLGGTAEAIGKFQFDTETAGLGELFYPTHTPEVKVMLTHRGGYEAITTEQAAIALRNYLTHGEPRWAEALAE